MKDFGPPSNFLGWLRHCNAAKMQTDRRLTQLLGFIQRYETQSQIYDQCSL